MDIRPSDIDVLLAGMTRQQYKELKKYTKDYNRDRYDHIFGSKRQNRIYLRENNPIVTDINLDRLFDANISVIYNNIIPIYNELPMIKTKLENVVNGRMFYEGNLLLTDKRTIKLSKVLDTLVKNIDSIEEASAYLKNNLKDWCKKVKKEMTNKPPKESIEGLNLIICISRSPYDVLSMSTGQRGTSCQNQTNEFLEDGSYDDEYYWDDDAKMFIDYNSGGRRYAVHALEDVKEGTLIAYLINKNDKTMKKILPYGRLLIKPEVTMQGDWVLVPDARIYQFYDLEKEVWNEFRKTVTEWVEQYNDYIENAIYELPERLYDDMTPNGVRSWKYKIDTSVEGIKAAIEKTKPNRIGHKWCTFAVRNTADFLEYIKNLDSLNLPDTIHINLSLINYISVTARQLPKKLNYTISSFIREVDITDEYRDMSLKDRYDESITKNVEISFLESGESLFDSIGENGGLENINIELNFSDDYKRHWNRDTSEPLDEYVMLCNRNDGYIKNVYIGCYDNIDSRDFMGLPYKYLVKTNSGILDNIEIVTYDGMDYLTDSCKECIRKDKTSRMGSFQHVSVDGIYY